MRKLKNQRYYTQPANTHQTSPENINNLRYSKFKGLPINLDSNIIYPQIFNSDYLSQNDHNRSHSYEKRPYQYGNHENNSGQRLKNSNVIYRKPGRHKPNQVGWDGVKISQYVLNNMSSDYIQNSRVLQKFKKEAEQNRKKKIHGHQRHNSSGLPVIYEKKPQKKYLNSRATNNPQHYLQSPEHTNEHKQYRQPKQPKFSDIYVRNVGVNTNKQYEINQLQKYVSLQQKYYRLKQKYKRYKKQSHKKNHQRILSRSTNRQDDHIDQIQNKLSSISMQLNQNNQTLAKILEESNQNKSMQCKPQLNFSNHNQNSHQAMLLIPESRLSNESKLVIQQISKQKIYKETSNYFCNKPKIVYSIPKKPTLLNHQKLFTSNLYKTNR